mmetsp:Transcript_20868/g.30740  ORF Transcript_20868/g.30740 Transcript_20868/m.30740 type:complete len:510 (+) Transcript_20868:70-1599(+)
MSTPDILSGDTSTAAMEQGESGAGYVNMDSSRPLSSNKNDSARVVFSDGVDFNNRKDGNDDDCDMSYAGSILSSVLSADGISDPLGFTIICFVILVGDMSRGIFFPTMWPLVEELGGSTVALGYAVGAFSFGRILVSPLFGSWSVKYGYSKTLQFSTLILLVGTILYAQTPIVGTSIFLIFAQTVLGIGSGTLGVTRAFVAEVTPQRTRTTYMAWITAVEYAGFTVTPFIGSMFLAIFQNGNLSVETKYFVLNEYTAPAYFMTILVLIIIFMLFKFFKDRQRTSPARKPGIQKSKKRAAIDELAESKTIFGLTTYDACIFGCMAINATTKGSIASFETLGIQFAQEQIGLSSAEAGAIVATCGSLGAISLLCLGHISKYMNDVGMIVWFTVAMVAGVLVLIVMGDPQENSAATYIFSASIFFIYSLGYPIGHAANIGLFSKIVGRRPQGALLGWFSFAGSLARMLFPLMSGYVTNYLGINVLFWILTFVLGISAAAVFVARDALTKLSQ